MRTLGLLSLLLLAACASPGSNPPPANQPAEKVPTAPAPVEILPVQKEAPPLALPEPGRLSGLNPKQIQALVGEPSLVRRDGHVQVMLFENAACVLEIIFYEANPDAHFIANRLNARNRAGVETNLQACLVNLLPNGQWLDATGSND